MNIKQSFIALSPILLVVWLILGFADSFMASTIIIGTSCISAALIVWWVRYVNENFEKW